DIIQAWPGIFKWSAYLFTYRIQVSSTDKSTNTAPPQRSLTRAILRDVIAAAWCSLAFSKSAREVMLQTRGVVDVAARLWFFEGNSEVSPVADGLQMGAFLLKILSDTDEEADWDRIISAAGGDVKKIVKISLTRLKDASKAPEFASSPLQCFAILSFIERLCVSPKPKVFQTLLDHGLAFICVRFLIRIASVINEGSHNADDRAEFAKIMVATFRVLLFCLEDTIGLPWVLQATNAGLLTAFVECSPLYKDLNHDDYTTVSTSVNDTIPRYLAYSSVVQAVDAALLKLKKTERFLSLQRSRAWEAFNGLALLTARRFRLVGQLKYVKKNLTTCSNPRCLKVDLRDTFRKCSKCRTAVYCSTECQTTHWSDSSFNHKKECHERPKGDPDPEEYMDLSGRDSEYLILLNITETRYNLPRLKHLAATEYSGTPLHDLVVVIDYNSVPTTTLFNLRSTWEADQPKLFKFPQGGRLPNLEPMSTTVVIGTVPYAGKGTPRYHVTPIPGGIWNLDKGVKGRQAGARFAKRIDQEVQAKRKLYSGV
ncbi:hypothetical protein BDN72DRAFT_134187, partial [Pluteus cervinus]